jgi:DedD protein
MSSIDLNSTDSIAVGTAADSAGVAPAEDDDLLRKRLLSRIAVAGVAIVGLLGGLAVYDSLNKPQTTQLPQMADSAQISSAASEEDETLAEKETVEEVSEAEQGSTEKVLASDKIEAQTEAVADAPPSVQAAMPPAKALTPPASARPAAIKPSAPVAVTSPKADAQRDLVEPVPEETHATSLPPPVKSVRASRPLQEQATTAIKRFLVQVGVFSNHANAEELVAKLQQAGIPAQIESRVQIGPFASRAEANAARSKLKALGIDEGMLVRR